MDYAACNVVYVDRTAREDRLVRKEVLTASKNVVNTELNLTSGHAPFHSESNLVEDNIRTLLNIFSEIHVCTSGRSCVAKLSELNQASIVELIPTLVLIDIPYDDQLHDKPSREHRTPSPSSKDMIDGMLEDHTTEAYGLQLLQWISTEIQYQSLSRLVVPVAVVRLPEQTQISLPTRRRTDSNPETQRSYSSVPWKKKAGLVAPLDQLLTMRYLDAGAADVLTSPVVPERLPSLGIHAYRAHKDASKEHRAMIEMKRGRKRSWVGVDDQKPYAYLREAMVSGLMDGICKLGGYDEPLTTKVRIIIALDRRDKIAASIGTWHFSAHDFTDDELLHAALLMLQHALAMPELEQWRISTENLTAFLIASRSAYNAFVPYHNFRHVVDVLQACFHFLVQLGRLPSYPASHTSLNPPPSPLAELIRPFDALTLLITAIGHDVGHPGVNNAFLVTLNAPLAQLYNDRSVLESFHCAAYSQILRRHWPAAFNGPEMRQLMISSILATDMGLHFDYMKKLGWLQEKMAANDGTEGWDGRSVNEHRTLACSLLIKCADISNVARRYDVASQWTMILTDEFARQASMEQDLGIPSALFAAPVREIVELGKSQLGFMNMFAIPLFQGITDVMPGMAFCVKELQANKQVWDDKIAQELKAREDSDDSTLKDGMFSPRSVSIATSSDGNQNRCEAEAEADLRKAVPNAPNLNTLRDTEEVEHHASLPELHTGGLEESLASSTEASLKRAPKPVQLQLPFATASAPEATGKSDISVTPSLVTDAVVVDCTAVQQDKGGSSDGTEGSGITDWTSQATSATTGQMPLSPSTQSTSLHSNEETGSTPTGLRCPSHLSKSPSPSAKKSIISETSTDGLRGEKDRMKTLTKRPSRFRMNFWKRKDKESPPLPHGVGSYVENGTSS